MTTEDILAELRSETAKLFEDNKSKVKTDPEKTYLDYLKATRSRSQFTIYDEDHNPGESLSTIPGIDLHRIEAAAEDDYRTRHYADDNVELKLDQLAVALDKIRKIQEQQRKLEIPKNKSTIYNVLRMRIPAYVTLENIKITKRGIVKSLYWYYLEQASKNFGSRMLKNIAVSIRENSSIRIYANEIDSIVVYWKKERV